MRSRHPQGPRFALGLRVDSRPERNDAGPAAAYHLCFIAAIARRCQGGLAGVLFSTDTGRGTTDSQIEIDYTNLFSSIS